MTTQGLTSDHGQLDRLAEEFLDRQRRGEQPVIAEYVARHPEWADEIREVFSALVMMEQFKPTPDDLTGSHAGAPTGSDGTSRRLGDYRILRQIGRGGMGIVYEAVQESLGRHVALKVLPEHGRMDACQLERFHLEARSAARLHHTNIVPVFDIGEHDGVHFYSMQFIRSQGLDVILQDLRRLRDRVPAAPTQGEALTISVAQAHGLLAGATAVVNVPPSGEATEAGTATDDEAPTGPSGTPSLDERSELIRPSEVGYYRSVTRIGARLADALAYAHAQGVLHRDIKPSNLLLDAGGEVWVADFGLAKLEGSDGPTAVGDVVGTLRYMAPERFQGRSDPRSDVYGLGATLYELLALQPAFDDQDRLRLIDRIAREAPAPLHRVDRLVPLDLEAIVLKSLAKDPDDRFPTAAELRDELNRFLQNRPTRTRPLSPAERLWRWCRRNPLVAGLNVLAAALTILVAIISSAAAWTYYGQRNEIAGHLVSIQRAEADGRERLFEALTERAKAGRFSRRVGQRFGGLEALTQAAQIGRGLNLPAERLDPLRDEAIACLALPDLQPTGRVLRSPPGALCYAFAPRMDRYALRFRNGEVVVRRMADDGEIARFRARGDREILVFRFSPDGRYLATNHFPGWGLTVWDVDRGTVALEDPGPMAGQSANFSPDGQQFILAHQGGETSVYDLASGRLARRWAGPEHTHGLAFRPDGAQVAVAGLRAGKELCEVVDISTGKVLRSFPLPAGGDMVAWSPDGRTLATPCFDRRIYLWDPETGVRKGHLEGHTNGGLYAAFHPSGLLLASNGWEWRLRLWDPLLCRPVLNLPSVYATLVGSDVGRDGQIVALVEDELTPYRIDPALEYRTLIRRSTTPMEYARVSMRRDGRLLAVGGDRGVVLFDLARGHELGHLPTNQTWNILFEESGDLLTSGFLGVCRWPIRAESGGAGFRIGPPTRLLLSRSALDLAEDRGGRVIALADFDTVKLQTGGRVSQIGPVDRVRYVAVSPDGRWLATGEHGGGAQVWRLHDATKVAELPYEGLCTVAFSPDGKWLITNGGSCRLWEVGTWREVRRIGGRGIAFAPDGLLLIVQDPTKILRLVAPGTGRTVARLESPDLCNADHATFSPDGAQLVVTTNEGPAVHVWDLRVIRRHLARMGLDWDAAPYPDPDPADASAPPLRLAAVDFGPLKWALETESEPPESVIEGTTARLKANPDEVEAHHQRGHALFRLKRYEEAVADFTVALRSRPNDAHLLISRALAEAGRERLDAVIADGEAALRLRAGRPDSSEPDALTRSLALFCNNQAWTLANGPASARDPARAVSLARAAVGLAPDEAIYLNTLGVALYRDVRHAEAVSVLERSLAAGKDQSDAFDLFLLVMCRHRLGDAASALVDFARAVLWLDAHPNLEARWLAELRSFRAEAESVLADLPGELPADIFAPITDG